MSTFVKSMNVLAAISRLLFDKEELDEKYSHEVHKSIKKRKLRVRLNIADGYNKST